MFSIRLQVISVTYSWMSVASVEGVGVAHYKPLAFNKTSLWLIRRIEDGRMDGEWTLDSHWIHW